MTISFRNKWYIFLFLASGIICGIGIGAFLGLTHDLPQIRALENYKPSAVTRVYSSDNVLLSEFYVEKRVPVRLQDIPKHLIDALITTEDRNFYHHLGIDIKGILRAAVKDIIALDFIEGASTITQQLAKTLFLTKKKALIRKIREAILAIQLERRYTKDEILNLYLNQVYFGSGAYGVESAARIFFGKSVQTLSLAECALIAGMPQLPSVYSPLVHPKRALKRRNLVLKQMMLTNIIDRTAYEKAVREPLSIAPKPVNNQKTPYFISYIKKKLINNLGASLLYKGGLTIHTTLSYKLQKAAERAVFEHMKALDARMVAKSIHSPAAQCALISVNVSSGGILAMVGGRNYQQSVFNRATDALRQPGSAFKPFVYAEAIENGLSQNALILDAPVAFEGAEKGTQWRPDNYSKKYSGEITLRYALAESKNIPAVKLIHQEGVASVCQFVHALGIHSPLSPYLSLALGTSEVSLIELTSAYAVFANRGEHITPYGVVSVKDLNGRPLWHVRPQRKAIMSRTGAAIITNMLEGVIKEGTGRGARILKRAVAGKTGTTNDYKDALFVGYSPSIATGVWVGEDDHSSLGHAETGAKAALPIWIDVMQESFNSDTIQYFDIPENVIRVDIDPITGQKASAATANPVTALFRKGTEPS